MKVAIIHDWLNRKAGGAESVLFELAQTYPRADIFTLIYDKDLFGENLRGRIIKTSFLQKMPRFIKHRPQFMLPLVKRATESIKLDGYDLIISSSSAWVKNINKPPGAVHICYCHSPARMLWDSWPSYLDQIGVLNKGFLAPSLRFLVIRLCSKLRLWDYYGAQKVDVFIANSKYVAGRIAKFYGRISTVVYPPVDTESALLNQPKKDYYLILSVLARYKNVELAVKSFAASGRKLIVAGDGADRERLKNMAAGATHISFYGRVSDTEKWRLLASAKGLIFPSIEDFGITPVEAMASGTPVVAIVGGGLTETVKKGVTGLFFKHNDPDELTQAIKQVEQSKFDQKVLREQAAKFKRTAFVNDFKRIVGKNVR